MEDDQNKRHVDAVHALVSQVVEQARTQRGHALFSVAGIAFVRIVVVTCHTCECSTHIDIDGVEVMNDELTTRGCIRLN
jgi:hypothetical protein